MPKRARVGDRERIEEELAPELLRALEILCEQRGVRPQLWQTQPDLEKVFTTYAVTAHAATLEAQGLTAEKALTHAAIRLGVEPSTIAARQVRHRRYALKIAA